MDKKQLLWFVLLLIAGVYFFQQTWGKGKSDDQPAVAPAPAVQPVTPAEWSRPGGRRITFDAQGLPTVRPILGSLDPESDYRFQVELDPRGASIHTVKLAGHYDTAEHKRQRDKTMEQLQEWSYSLLSPVRDGARLTLPFATSRILVNQAPVDTFNISNNIGWIPGDVVTDENGVQSVDFTLTLYRGDDRMLRAVKTYSLAPNSNSLRVAMRLENISGETQQVSMIQYGPTGLPREDIKDDLRFVTHGELLPQDRKVAVPRLEMAGELQNVPAGQEFSIGSNEGENPLLWAGQGNKFFTCLMYPVPPELEQVTGTTPLENLAVNPQRYSFAFFRRVLMENPNSRTQVVIFQSADQEVAPAEALEFNFDVYLGPKSMGIFDRTPLYALLNYRDTIQFGGCFCTIAPLVRGVMWLLEAGGRLLGNYGIVIILLVAVVRVLLHPITKRSQISMMKLGKLGPEMEKIKQKYKDDQQAQQKAMMEFMRKQGASPILGCLPMLLQMPIWIALWSGLSAEVQLRHAMLDPWWINDLSAPDNLIPFGTALSVPLVGNVTGLNLLPLLLAVAMFLQQKLTPMSAQQVTATPEQKAQQKMMMYMMTGMFLLIFYNAPSGLTLYVMASTAVGVVESQIVRKHIREKEQLEAATETRIEAPGKPARGQRPKKPKGPFKF